MKKSKRKGKSHSTRPVSSGAKTICTMSTDQVENLIIELARKGYQPSMIGTILRDQYAVPSVREIVGVKLTKFLREKNLAPALPEDLGNLIKRAAIIRRHLEEHPKDKHSQRGLQLTESKIHRLVKYYRKAGVLPPSFEYKPEKLPVI